MLLLCPESQACVSTQDIMLPTRCFNRGFTERVIGPSLQCSHLIKFVIRCEGWIPTPIHGTQTTTSDDNGSAVINHSNSVPLKPLTHNLHDTISRCALSKSSRHCGLSLQHIGSIFLPHSPHRLLHYLPYPKHPHTHLNYLVKSISREHYGSKIHRIFPCLITPLF